MPIKLKDTKVELEALLLDADNYRVAKSAVEQLTSIEDTRLKQSSILKDLKKQKLDDLKDSILKNGFLTVDRIVVKKVTDTEYLVIEGNRRVAALKSIKEDYEKGYIDSDNINNLITETEYLSAVLVEGTAEEIKNYSNALMGIRHVSGAKKWHGWQSAKLVNSMVSNGHSLTEVGEMLGITSKDAGRRLRGYRVFQQLEMDPTFGSKRESHHYAILLEFLSPNKNGRTWLDWQDTSLRFENPVTLKRLYEAIVKDDNGEYEVRNIDDARDFLTKLSTEQGQNKILAVKNFRDVKVVKEEQSVFDTVCILLKAQLDKRDTFEPLDIEKIIEIKCHVLKLLGED